MACFRRQKTAAPLKQTMPVSTTKVFPSFPPSKNGGPIEAQASDLDGAIPLEFPPSKNGGPIEAPIDWQSYRKHLAGFRRQKTAAPLKRQVQNRLQDSGDCFRRQKTAAPLKPNRVNHRCQNLKLFPPSKNGGPIEARQCNAAADAGKKVSAVKKRRPH